MILHGLHEIEQQYIEAFIQGFWLPLTAIANEQPRLERHYCLLFLIDDRGCQWDFPFAQQLDRTWKPQVPIQMEKLTRFPPEELLRWMEAGIDILPSSLTLDDLLENCENGLPELVLKRICKLCGDDWHRRERVWIIY